MFQSKLKNIINSDSFKINKILNHIYVAEEPKTNELIRQLMTLDLGEIDSEEIDKDKLLKLFVEKYISGKKVEINKRDWRNFVWCLEVNQNYSQELCDNKQLRQDILERINGLAKISELKSYIRCYFVTFRLASKITQFLGEMVIEILKTNKFEKFSNLHNKFEVFQPKDAVSNLAKGLLAYETTSIKNSFSKEGFNLDDVTYDNFYSEIYSSLCKQVSNTKADQEILQELTNWSISNDQLRYEDKKYELLDALLLPWKNTSPDQEFKDSLIKFILKHYSDPRMKPANWISVSKQAESVFLRWMASKSMEQFFSIVDKLALPRHWNYRRKFWEAYLNKGVDIEVWIVFASKCASLSKNTFEDLEFAEFSSGSGIQSNHACLIIKLDNLIITEWSDNGACRIWKDTNKSSPTLYKKIYNPDALKKMQSWEDGYFIHRNPEVYSWQLRVSSFIRAHTNIQVNQSEYRV